MVLRLKLSLIELHEHRAAGLQEDANGFKGSNLVQACHLYQCWSKLHKKRTTSTDASELFSPVDIANTQAGAVKHHHTTYTAWQTADALTLGWIFRNYDRSRYMVNDLSKVRSMTTATQDGLHDSA